MPHHFLASGEVLPAKCGVKIPYDAFYCGPEGFLTGEELEARTRADIERYARDNPLRYRHAMISHDNPQPISQCIT